MTRAELLQEVVRLGKELRRRGLDSHLRRLRLYYRAVQDDLTTGGQAAKLEVGWSADHTLDLLRLLRVPPHHQHYQVRPQSSRCDHCSAVRAMVRVVGQIAGTTKVQCGTCGSVWLEIYDT